MYYTNWYNKLNKSKLTPPNYIFSIIWIILYIMLAVSFLTAYNKCNYLCFPIILFLFQLVLNFSWTTVFFKFKNPIFAFIITLLIIFLTIMIYFKFLKINKLSAYFLMPYLLWLIFAAYLNFFIILYN